MANRQIGVSVIICCYNARERLPQTLKHLAQQEVGCDLDWEVVIVDNCSTDGTSVVAEEEWNAQCTSVPLRIVDQPVPGKASAQTMGINVSQYEYVLICDDDNWLNKNYVRTVYEVLNTHSDVGAVGGRGIAHYEIDPPAWIKECESGSAVGPQNRESGHIDENPGSLYGAGLAFRFTAVKKAIDKGFQFFLSGRKGKNMTPGEDTELVYIFQLEGWRLWYEETMHFEHYIPAHRISESFIRKRSQGFGASSVVLDAYKLVFKRDRLKFFIKSRWYLNVWVVLLQIVLNALKNFLLIPIKKKRKKRTLVLEWYKGKLKELFRLNYQSDIIFNYLQKIDRMG